MPIRHVQLIKTHTDIVRKSILKYRWALLTYTLGMGIWFGENVRSQHTRESDTIGFTGLS